MSICYTSQHGIAMGRHQRPLVAWYGDLDFMPHIKALIQRGAVDAVVSYGEPIAVDGGIGRKAITRRLEAEVRRLTASALRGRPRPARRRVTASIARTWAKQGVRASAERAGRAQSRPARLGLV